MPNPHSAARIAASEQRIRDLIAELVEAAPLLTEEMRNELRPLILAENVQSDRGQARGRADGSSHTWTDPEQVRVVRPDTTP